MTRGGSVMTETANPENNLSIKKVDQKTSDKQRASADTVFVGKKPTMAYVLAVITQFSEGGKEVHLKARGKSISRAVDVAEVVKNKFLTSVKATVGIGTEVVESEEGRGKINVSTIDIHLIK